MGLAMFAGTVAIADFAALGIGLRTPRPDLLRQTAGWRRAGLTALLITGTLLFFADPGRYLDNPAFRLKMVLAAAALAIHFAIRGNIAGRPAAVLSLALWTAVVLAARAIADFDI
jgi:hypothetical protein